MRDSKHMPSREQKTSRARSRRESQKTSRRKRKGVGSRTKAQMAEGGSSSAAGERGREGDMEPGRVREMLREILMEIPGFQALEE